MAEGLRHFSRFPLSSREFLHESDNVRFSQQNFSGSKELMDVSSGDVALLFGRRDSDVPRFWDCCHNTVSLPIRNCLPRLLQFQLFQLLF